MHAALQQHEEIGLATVGAGGTGYRRHRPEETALYGVVGQHAHAFFDGQEELGRGLPRFVREEFEAYLRCGRLEWGFIRAKCTGCRHEHLVAFSCKRRESKGLLESRTYLADIARGKGHSRLKTRASACSRNWRIECGAGVCAKRLLKSYIARVMARSPAMPRQLSARQVNANGQQKMLQAMDNDAPCLSGFAGPASRRF